MHDIDAVKGLLARPDGATEILRRQDMTDDEWVVVIEAIDEALAEHQAALAADIERLTATLTPLLVELAGLRREFGAMQERLHHTGKLELAAGGHLEAVDPSAEALAAVQSATGYFELETLVCGHGLGDLLYGDG